jgi:hypothetical protein
LETSNFRKALEGDVSKFVSFQELRQDEQRMREEKTEAYPSEERVDNVGLKDITKWDPVEEAQEALQGSLDQGRLLSFVEHLGAQPENIAEFATHLILEIFYLRSRHLLRRIVENLFR